MKDVKGGNLEGGLMIPPKCRCLCDWDLQFNMFMEGQIQNGCGCGCLVIDNQLVKWQAQVPV